MVRKSDKYLHFLLLSKLHIWSLSYCTILSVVFYLCENKNFCFAHCCVPSKSLLNEWLCKIALTGSFDALFLEQIESTFVWLTPLTPSLSTPPLLGKKQQLRGVWNAGLAPKRVGRPLPRSPTPMTDSFPGRGSKPSRFCFQRRNHFVTCFLLVI